ncbi:hypothetical protein [Hymenobacter persicinus]|uniref:Uncharacterized protein n=1 Tax=Hymenobacter persicinus TaxID=2025506 RepID=A0A4Q5LCD3_9BACT|nr:hypothetical protein [Hymenobacter persicinus]RYU79121.1 hypothetical protein EWM57_11335 [Hymenobacter persicinus]
MRRSLLTLVLLWLLSAPQWAGATPVGTVVRPAGLHRASQAALLGEPLLLNGEAVAPVAPGLAPLVPHLPLDFALLPLRPHWLTLPAYTAPARPTPAGASLAQRRLLRASVAPQAP